MNRIRTFIVFGIALVTAGVWAVCSIRLSEPVLRPEQILAAYRQDARYGELTVTYPLDETLFPPDVAAPTFRWEDGGSDSDAWLLSVDYADGDERLSRLTNDSWWKPSEAEWRGMKERSRMKPARVTLLGVNSRRPDEIISAANITFSTSEDPVDSPIFYREVHLPFLETVTDPAKYIRWRFGTVDATEQPPVVLEGLPNCANCHSFTADGATLAMEVDSANDKGSYVIAPVEEEIVFDAPKILTWSDYKREDGQATFGLLAQISPDGKYVICMVKDRSVFVDMPDLAFSQLFFPIRGILVYYSRQTQTFHSLPGADDPRYVQANPIWSPDGKYVVFARHEAHYFKDTLENNSILLDRDEAKEFTEEGKTFKYDLYRIPFNDGAGGTPEPLTGASGNGMSNYFPKYSPDGKWIVFCRAKSFMLLQPDSRLWIIPAEGGEARELRCNTSRMNSWHSWSPNGKWLVFSSKANSAYTQLFLTHVDEDGITTPPIVLDIFTGSTAAANIPEFVNVAPGAIKSIRQEFLDDASYYRAGQFALSKDDYDSAKKAFRTSLRLNPDNTDAKCKLGVVLMHEGMLTEAEEHFRKLIDQEPGFVEVYTNLGNVLCRQGRFEEALVPLRESLRLAPDDPTTHLILGNVLTGLRQGKEARQHLDMAMRWHPKYAEAYRYLDQGTAALDAGSPGQALDYYRQALNSYEELIPVLLATASILATSQDDSLRQGAEAVRLAEKACQLSHFSYPSSLAVLAAAYAESGQFGNAVHLAQRAIQFARSENQEDLATLVGEDLRLYQENKPCRRRQFPLPSP